MTATPTAFTIAVRGRYAVRAALLAAWYGPVRETNPRGRRIYGYGCVHHMTEHHAPLRTPPSHADGRERLRSILKDWRSSPVFMPLSAWDDEHGGHLRRAIVKAGLLLLVEDENDDDARERADAIVQRVAHTVSPRGLNAMAAFMDALALLPVGPWDVNKSGSFSRD